MKQRSVIQDATCVLLILLLGYACASHIGEIVSDVVQDIKDPYLWKSVFGVTMELLDYLFNLFVLLSLLVTIILHICRLLHVSFRPRKNEKIIALTYIIVFMLFSFFGSGGKACV